ncbi:MAG: pyridoxamine 5'-phosphate oxidase family protein [Acidobacteriota bacterium]|nr:pyridoxamine 5'-phosphate oxidase family protein [Acidobacteriota bacterium]
MFIHEMTDDECRSALQEASVGRLGCARDNQPYVVPIYFVFDGKHLYGFTTVGQKIEWMRANPQICLEIDEQISPDQWMSVIVFGRYEELLDEPQYEAERMKAHELLQGQRALWWEPSYMSAAHRDGSHSLLPVFYRIQIARMTGHRATPDIAAVPAHDASHLIGKGGWIDSILRHIRMTN